MTGEPVDYLLPEASMSRVLNKIYKHSKGSFNFKHEIFLRERQEWLNGYRKVWQKEESEIISKNYYQNFNGFIQDYFVILKSDYRNMQWIRELLFITTDNKIILNFNEIEVVLNNLNSYPALRSLIYVHLYLVFLTEANGETPSEDRFTDCLISIESSYCTTLVSNDKRFIHNHAKKVNPYIEVITLQELTDSDQFYSS